LPSQITLITKGRHTGQQRSVVLYAYDDDGSLIVVGSNGGSKNHPGWVHNLRAHPAATVRRGKTEALVTAEEVTDQRRDLLWDLVCGQFPLYATYQKRCERTIPLFLLKPS
jgi:deazaflavin-dependent oxidoreductase (nitroreductase family)